MADNTILIPLPDRFTFEARVAFREHYLGLPVPEQGYVVDFTRTNFIDSAGLGMLLQLREFAGGTRDRIRFVRLQPAIRELLRVAEFPSLVTID